MKKILLTALVLASAMSMLSARTYRYIHNCDGTDLIGNFENNHRPLSVADINKYVDLLCVDGGPTTLMVCSGSDFANYRSKYARMIGDDRNGTLRNFNDTANMNYYRNVKLIEAEGTDPIRAYLTRAKENGKEAFITYRMNDLHSNDPANVGTLYGSDFWSAHTDMWVGDEGHGWHREAALDFAYPEVRELKYNMLAEQLEMYGDVMDGLEMDFCRFIVYFRLGEGWANKEKITDMVRRVKAKADEVSRANGHKILLTVRVPDTWLSCMDNGLDVQEWVKEGLVDFISLAVHWKGDPAVDADSFRKESGIGNRIPIYVTMDDGGFKPREFYSHSEMRGAVSYAFSHGADGMYLFNYFFGPEIASGAEPKVENGIVSHQICPQMLPELGTAKGVEGLNKTYAYYSGNAEYGLSYKSPMPLHPSKYEDAKINFFVDDRMKPKAPHQAILFYRVSKGADIRVSFNGTQLQHSAEDAPLPALYCKNDKLEENEAGCFIVPVSLVKHGDNSVVISTDTEGVTINKIELTLGYGDVKEYGLF